MALSSNLYALEVQKLEKILEQKSVKTGKDFGANSSSKSARMAKLWQFSQGHAKPAFSEKVQRGEQEHF